MIIYQDKYYLYMLALTNNDLYMYTSGFYGSGRERP